MSLAFARSLCCAVLVALLRWRNKPLSFTRVPFRQGLAQREPHGRRSTTDFPASRFRLLLHRKEYCRQRIRVQTDCSSARITAPTWSVTGAAALGGAGMLT